VTIKIQIKSKAALKIDKRSKTNIRHQDQETKILNKPISPRRLREGGAGILEALNKNHHIAIVGIKLIKSLLTKNRDAPARKLSENLCDIYHRCV